MLKALDLSNNLQGFNIESPEALKGKANTQRDFSKPFSTAF
jgi:hypothetical protein